MKALLIICVLICCQVARTQGFRICIIPGEVGRVAKKPTAPLSLGTVKYLRINYHFMLRTDGTGNFTETTDGNGGTAFNGYKIAEMTTSWINQSNQYNPPMNLPPGNTTPNLDKNYYFVTDAVYFHRDDAYFNYSDLANLLIGGYPSFFGKDHQNVLNIFFTYSPSGNEGGFATSLDPNSKVKFNVNTNYWQKYLADFAAGQNPMAYYFHGVGQQVHHEVGHLFGLLHTVRYGHAPPCPTNCPTLGGTPADLNCDDGCADTPNAWDMASLSGCTVHPASGWGQGSMPYKDNNLMDYSGEAALTPCQLNIVHGAIEGGMKTYTACDAVATNVTLCDLAYPKLTYFGRNVTVSCPATTATINNGEKISIWYSETVDFGSFEVGPNAEFELVSHGVCLF